MRAAPRAFMNRSCLFDGERTDDLDSALTGREDDAAGKVERRILGVRSGDFLEMMLAHGIDHAADAGPYEAPAHIAQGSADAYIVHVARKSGR